MVYPATHKLVTFSGGLFTGTLERWSFGLRFYNNPFVPPTQSMVDAIAPLAVTFWDSAISVGLTHGLDLIKLATIEPTGLYPPGFSPLLHPFSPPEFPPGVAANGLPGQISQVVSLRTNLPRGRAHAGRIYLPSTGQSVGTDGRWTAVFSTGVANAVKTLINGISGISGMGSPVVMSDLGAGAVEIVTGLRVGRVPDTVRRRRRQLVEDYQSVTL